MSVRSSTERLPILYHWVGSDVSDHTQYNFTCQLCGSLEFPASVIVRELSIGDYSQCIYGYAR